MDNQNSKVECSVNNNLGRRGKLRSLQCKIYAQTKLGVDSKKQYLFYVALVNEYVSNNRYIYILLKRE